MSSDTLHLTASTTVNGETISITLPVPGPLWERMGNDYMLTARTHLATEIIKHLDVEYIIATQGADE